MAGTLGESDPGLTSLVAESPGGSRTVLPIAAERIPFFQLVHLLLRAEDQASPGRLGPPSRELIRFRAAASLAFAPTDVAAVEEIEDHPDPWEPPRRLHRITVNFLGLYGPASPMPNHLTEEILQAGPDADAVRDFLDLFNHRLIAFVYRAWERVRPYLRHEPGDETGDKPGERDDWTRRYLAFLGLGTEGAAAALSAAWAPLLRSAGLFATTRRSAAGLESLLRDLLPGVAVRVESCVPRWIRIPAESLVRLGSLGRLGEDARVGTAIRDAGGSFRIHLGPLPIDRYRSLLPDREAFARLAAQVRFYTPDALIFTFRLHVRAAEVPPVTLVPGADFPLGHLSWLGSPRGGIETVDLAPRGHDPLSAGARAA
jgi:type VI secretion system protein ImpH